MNNNDSNKCMISADMLIVIIIVLCFASHFFTFRCEVLVLKGKTKTFQNLVDFSYFKYYIDSNSLFLSWRVVSVYS